MTMELLSTPLRHFHTLPRQFHILCVMYMAWLTPIFGATYENVVQIFTDKLDSSSGYNTAVRPILNQSQVMDVFVGFDIIVIVEIDDINQRFIVNGFLTISWIDEVLAWDPAQYNGVNVIYPYPKQIWRPRLVLGNTLDKRDLFEDDYCTTTAMYDGNVTWHPGSLFPTSCELNLLKYPFDQQMCEIELYAMEGSVLNVAFNALNDYPGTMFYVENGEWEIVRTSLDTVSINFLPGFQVKFYLKRRHGFFVINVIMPVILLSFLNIMVFLIPVDSGEKISYGITVLLALAVFMSIISEMLPRSSTITPFVTIYLTVLLLISVSTVIVAILIVSFNTRDEKVTRHHRATESFKSILNKLSIIKKATTPLTKIAPAVEKVTSIEENEGAPPSYRRKAIMDVVEKAQLHNLKKPGSSHNTEKQKDLHGNHYVNRWRIIGRHIDFVSFVVFLTIWACVTIVFLILMTS